MRNWSRTLSALCIAFASVGLAEAQCFKHEFKQVTDGCEYGCFYYHRSNGSDGCRMLNYNGYRFKAFYLTNRGPRALAVMAVSPHSYYGWGCDVSIWGRTCNRIGRLESGETIFMEMIYGDEPNAGLFDFRFVDAADVSIKVHDVALPARRIPTIVYRSSSRGRDPSMTIEWR